MERVRRAINEHSGGERGSVDFQAVGIEWKNIDLKTVFEFINTYALSKERRSYSSKKPMKRWLLVPKYSGL